MRMEEAERDIIFFQRYFPKISYEFFYTIPEERKGVRPVRYYESLIDRWGFDFTKELLDNEIMYLKDDPSSKYTFAILHPKTVTLINRFVDALDWRKK